MADKNPIGWFEIHVHDIEKAKTFYGGVFGWEFKQSQAASGKYWNIFAGENSIGGGFMKKSKPEHEGQSVILYIETDDIDGMLLKINGGGGTTETPKTLISENAGYFALFKDPDNNLLGLWSKK